MPVSTRTRPVTQVAEVAVKRAVKGLVNLPEADEKGIISKTAPTIITARKLREIVLVGCIGLFFVFKVGILTDLGNVYLWAASGRCQPYYNITVINIQQ